MKKVISKEGEAPNSCHCNSLFSAAVAGEDNKRSKERRRREEKRSEGGRMDMEHSEICSKMLLLEEVRKKKRK